MTNDNIIGLTGDEEIYRITPMYRLEEIFNKKTLTLIKPKKWDDPFENLLLSGTYQMSSGRKFNLKAIRDSIYGQCWTLHKETDALWRIYSHDKKGVKVKTTVKKLITALLNQSGKFAKVNSFIGRVRYLDQEKLYSELKKIPLFQTSGAGIADTLLYKRIEFEHEKEVRLLYTEKSKNIHQFTVDPHDLFEEIVFDPRITKEDHDSFSQFFNNINYSGVIEKSLLYGDPPNLDKINLSQY